MYGSIILNHSIYGKCFPLLQIAAEQTGCCRYPSAPRVPQISPIACGGSRFSHRVMLGLWLNKRIIILIYGIEPLTS